MCENPVLGYVNIFEDTKEDLNFVKTGCFTFEKGRCICTGIKPISKNLCEISYVQVKKEL